MSLNVPENSCKWRTDTEFSCAFTAESFEAWQKRFANHALGPENAFWCVKMKNLDRAVYSTNALSAFHGNFRGSVNYSWCESKLPLSWGVEQEQSLWLQKWVVDGGLKKAWLAGLVPLWVLIKARSVAADNLWSSNSFLIQQHAAGGFLIASLHAAFVAGSTHHHHTLPIPAFYGDCF